MGACLLGHHLPTPPAKERMVEKERLDFEIISIHGIENSLCIIRPVIAAHPCVIPSNNNMRTAVILSHDGVMDGLP
jgi:hypothetical protein